MGPTGPARTRMDFFARPGPQTRVSDKVRGLCLVVSGRARVVEFSYNCGILPILERLGMFTVSRFELISFEIVNFH